MAAYLTRQQYADRMGVSLEDAPGDMQLRQASARVDSMGPFRGIKASSEQPLEFPRHTLTENKAVPEAVLDATCILAKAAQDGVDETPIKSESVLGASVTYDVAQVPRHMLEVFMLLGPFMSRTGKRL